MISSSNEKFGVHITHVYILYRNCITTYLWLFEPEHVQDSDGPVRGVPSDVYGVVERGHGLARLGTGRADGGRVLTGHLGLVMNRIVGVATQRAQRRTQSFQTVRPAHDGRHGPAVQRFGQRVSYRIGLWSKQKIYA